jgi:hypothetical protein
MILEEMYRKAVSRLGVEKSNEVIEECDELCNKHSKLINQIVMCALLTMSEAEDISFMDVLISVIKSTLYTGYKIATNKKEETP